MNDLIPKRKSVEDRRVMNRRENDGSGCPYLTPEQLEKIVENASERAAVKAVELMTNNVYRKVGKSVIEKLFVIVGAISIIIWIWLKEKGNI